MRFTSKKSIQAVLALAVVMLVFSSCNRGGSGCPYELEAAINILDAVIK